MNAALKFQRISVEDYLAGELETDIKHEYLAGEVYAMAGGTNAHGQIATNIAGALVGRLRGKPCAPANSDVKIRIQTATHTRFYYPDASVICEPNAPTDTFQDRPTVVFEVLSRATRRIDEGEKKDAYFTIPSLQAYVLVEQDSAAARVFRRTEEGFVCSTYVDLEAVIPLEMIDIELPLAEIYDRVEFVPEPEDD